MLFLEGPAKNPYSFKTKAPQHDTQVVGTPSFLHSSFLRFWCTLCFILSPPLGVLSSSYMEEIFFFSFEILPLLLEKGYLSWRSKCFLKIYSSHLHIQKGRISYLIWRFGITCFYKYEKRRGVLPFCLGDTINALGYIFVRMCCPYLCIFLHKFKFDLVNILSFESCNILYNP